MRIGGVILLCKFMMEKKMELQKLPQFQKVLFHWYKKNGRRLPWRETHDPYEIWISEIMLQQTRVETVIPYYHRFLAVFPGIATLARADLQEVLKVWEGLGYYSRVRNLHRAAQIIMSEYHGEFPREYGELLRLPGIGRYTAGAITSIAFNTPVPLVDGNVIRVLARLFEIETEISSEKNKRIFWHLAETLLWRKAPGDFNQALMELGAMICLPRNPRCRDCPVAIYCRARQNNRQHQLPIKKMNPPIPHYRIGVGLIWRDRRLLIARRAEQGLLGGLWEFPGGKQEDGESIVECIRREIREELQVEVKVLDYFMTVRHAYSHFRITMEVYHCTWISGDPRCLQCSDFRWVFPAELDAFPFPRANQKIIVRLKKISD